MRRCCASSSSLFNPEALFMPHRSACFDKTRWIISLKNYHLSLKWDTQDKRLHAVVIFALWETSVGPPTSHSFGRGAETFCVHILLIRNRWRWAPVVHSNSEVRHSIFHCGHSDTQVHPICTARSARRFQVGAQPIGEFHFTRSRMCFYARLPFTICKMEKNILRLPKMASIISLRWLF